MTNSPAVRIDAAKAFPQDVLGLDLVMDHGWILTFAAAGKSMTPQVSMALDGGSGAPVPDLSVEVDDLDEVLGRVIDAGLPVADGPALEPWGVRRFYVRDPFGKPVNVLVHLGQDRPCRPFAASPSAPQAGRSPVPRSADRPYNACPV